MEDSYNRCKAAVVAAYNLLADAILDLDKAAEAVKAAEAKVKGDEATEAAMLACHQTVADEYTADALKIQQQMDNLIAEREYVDKADFAILSSLIATQGGKRCRH